MGAMQHVTVTRFAAYVTLYRASTELLLLSRFTSFSCLVALLVLVYELWFLLKGTDKKLELNLKCF